MFHHDSNGVVYFKGQPLVATRDGIKVAESKNWVYFDGTKQWEPNEYDGQIVRQKDIEPELDWNKWAAEAARSIRELNKHANHTNKNAKTITENFKNVAKAVKTLEQRQLDLRQMSEVSWMVDGWSIDGLQQVCQELLTRLNKAEKEIENLKTTKMSRPSMSEELINAERYIDDALTLQSHYNMEKFRRKQKIRKKLERIKEANKPKPKVSEEQEDLQDISRWWTLAALVFPCAIVLLTMFFSGVF